MSPGTQTAWPIRDRRSGYTLVELLVVMAIIALLVSLLMTGLRSVMRQANSLVCMSNLRQIAFQFQRVAENPADLKRWDADHADLSGFGLTSFIDKVYTAGAYFRPVVPGESESVNEFYRGQEIFLCPAAPSRIRVTGGRRVLDPIAPAIMYPENVSYGFNARLHKIFRYSQEEGKWVERYVKLSLNMYDWPNAPRTALVFDVDARAAVKAESDPHLIAPPNEPIFLDDPDDPDDPIFGYQPGEDSLGLIHGRKWFPSQRHQGKTNVALLDGSVRSVKNLLAESERINWKAAVYLGRWVDGVYVWENDENSSMAGYLLWSDNSLGDEEVH